MRDSFAGRFSHPAGTRLLLPQPIIPGIRWKEKSLSRESTYRLRRERNKTLHSTTARVPYGILIRKCRHFCSFSAQPRAVADEPKLPEWGGARPNSISVLNPEPWPMNHSRIFGGCAQDRISVLNPEPWPMNHSCGWRYLDGGTGHFSAQPRAVADEPTRCAAGGIAGAGFQCSTPSRGR